MLLKSIIHWVNCFLDSNMTGWWFGTEFYEFPYIGNVIIFQRGCGSTTSQLSFIACKSGVACIFRWFHPLTSDTQCVRLKSPILGCCRLLKLFFVGGKGAIISTTML